MKGSIRVSAKTVDDAITEALIQLGVTSDRLEYDVIEKGSPGFLGIGMKQAVIEAWKKEEPEPEEDIFSMDFLKEEKEEKDEKPVQMKEEKEEQARLRKEYVTAIRESLRGHLNNISIVEKDGSITDLGKKFGGVKDV